MNANRMLLRNTPLALLALSFVLGAGAAFADNNGRTGKAQAATGCSCHGSTNTAGVVVTITGSQTVAINSTNTYTVTVSGGPANTQGGFDLKSSGGTLIAGVNNHVVGTEVTHSSSASRSWTFSWRAPATAGTQNFWAIAVAADGVDDPDGDQWNYYGGAMNTAFPISVVSSLGVGDAASLTWLAAPLPNPCANESRIGFSLAGPADVQLAVLDAAGRHVRALARGTMPAGRQSVNWDRRSENGSRVAAGVYFVQMTLADRVLSTRITVID